MFNIAEIFGGLVAVFLLSRLFWWLAKKVPDSLIKAAAIDLLTFVIAVLIASVGMANGGPLAWERAFSVYSIPAVIVFIIDVVRMRKKRAP